MSRERGIFMDHCCLDAHRLLEQVRLHQPVVHHLTNWVTIYDCAQVVKVLGASPVMAHAPEEMDDMTGIASALVLNIGTLTVDFVEAMKKAVARANQRGIPAVLDVCGAGATRLRDEKCFELLESGKISIIKGNASEIARISGVSVQTKGVDCGSCDGDLETTALDLARARKCAVVVTGPQDIVTDGTRVCRINNGDAMMARIVGTGCMAASVIGAFAAVEKDSVTAAAAGLVCFEIAGELAAARSQGPGTFKEQLFDALYHLDHETVTARQKVDG